MNVEKLKKMAGAVRTGGKGSMRRCVLVLPSTCAAVVALVSASTFHVVFVHYLIQAYASIKAFRFVTWEWLRYIHHHKYLGVVTVHIVFGKVR
jgi:hypothetical protein